MNADKQDGPTPAGWRPDPSGRHQYRYYDGVAWTDNVADNGEQTVDPLSPVGSDDPTRAEPSEASFVRWDLQRQQERHVPQSEPGPGWSETPSGGVTPLEAVKRGFNKGLDFKGRAPRSEYWWFLLFIWLALMVLSALVGGAAGPDASEGVVALAVLAAAVPLLAAATRRLHDTGRRGAWLLIALVPLIGLLILLVLLAAEGERRANEFGPPVSSS